MLSVNNNNFKIMFRYSVFSVVSCLVIFSSGCSTLVSSRSQKEDAMKHYSAGEYEKSAGLIKEYADKREGTGDELMWHLEHGCVRFAMEDYPISLEAFNKAEAAVLDHENRATFNLRGIGAEIGAAYTNANALPYTGCFFEKILINTYKSMVYMGMNNPEAAGVEMRRARFRQKMARRRYEVDLVEEYQFELPKYQGEAIPGLSPDKILQEKEIKKDREWIKKHRNTTYGNVVNPTVTFLSAIDFLARKRNDDALIDFRTLYRIEPKNPLFRKCYVSMARSLSEQLPAYMDKLPGYKFPLDRKVVFVLFEDGLIPARKEKLFELILPPPVGYTGIAYPVLEYFPSDAGYLKVRNEDGKVYRTEMIGDLGDIASFTLDDQMHEIITRAVVGAMVKEGTSIALQQAAARIPDIGPVVQIGVFIAMQIYKKAFNRADVRCWQTLPGRIQGAVFPKTGNGIFKLTVMSRYGKEMNSANINVGTRDTVTLVLVKSNGFDTIRLKVFDF